MFFPEKIKGIKKGDKVLEVGPGGSPYFRADVLLEKDFDEAELFEQRGKAPLLKTDKKIVVYSGDRFPFMDKEFDYVVCSHVLEHVDDVDLFLKELSRVAKAGYLEFPTVYYEYLYNFKVHKNIIFNRDGAIFWLEKKTIHFDRLFEVNKFFYESLIQGRSRLIEELKEYFFQGFEWSGGIESKKVVDIREVCFDENTYKSPALVNEFEKNKGYRIVRFIERKLKYFYKQ